MAGKEATGAWERALRRSALLLFAALAAACSRADAEGSHGEREAPVARRLPKRVDPEWVHFTEPAVEVGDVAPDFELVDAGGKGTHRLSSLRGRPVLLVFASYT